MSSIHSIIYSATAALSEITPETLSTDRINNSRSRLDAIHVNEIIDNYWNDLPPKPDKESDWPKWESEMIENGNSINHELHRMNEELSRLKSLRQTLSLDQLDPLIHSAQEIIRPLYNFTAQLNS